MSQVTMSGANPPNSVTEKLYDSANPVPRVLVGKMSASRAGSGADSRR